LSGLDEQAPPRCPTCRKKGIFSKFWVLRKENLYITTLGILPILPSDGMCSIHNEIRPGYFIWDKKFEKYEKDTYTLDGLNEIICDRGHYLQDEHMKSILIELAKRAIKNDEVRWECLV